MLEKGLFALRKYGKENIAYFCDLFIQDEDVQGIPVICFEQLCTIHQDYQVVVTPIPTDVRKEIKNQLDSHQIPFLLFGREDTLLAAPKVIHIHGTAPIFALMWEKNLAQDLIDFLRNKKCDNI